MIFFAHSCRSVRACSLTIWKSRVTFKSHGHERRPRSAPPPAAPPGPRSIGSPSADYRADCKQAEILTPLRVRPVTGVTLS
ncbi:hypothetical protein EVAR_28671_1 [Eumeta japonica]|uniref:Uncharacterized protein n=1 Tax=Eumeta variegata TaxID=151549 RepID=A0A4C1V580_EUMVA|nr:hypothetical protein EVAR_28671_1 [Eumeta japonica]